MRLREVRHLCAIACAVIMTAQVAPAQNRDDKTDKMKQRLEQLFVWRVSDRLSLTPSQEQEFSSEFHKISEERSKLSGKMDSLLDDMDKDKQDSSKVAKLLAEYELTLKQYNALQLREMEVMKRVFDSKKLAEYVLLKREMTQKFKDVLSSQNTVSSAKNPDKTNLKEPQVIQEK
jgi:hypothetical protein